MNNYIKNKRLNPKSAASYYDRGLDYQHKGQLKEAISDYTNSSGRGEVATQIEEAILDEHYVTCSIVSFDIERWSEDFKKYKKKDLV